MATLQERGGGFRVLFRFRGKQYALGLGKVPADAAEAKRAAVESALAFHKAGLKPIPAGVDVVEYLRHDGQVPVPPEAPAGPPR